MEFDIKNVYTAVNADELHVVDTVIVANNFSALKYGVKNFKPKYLQTIIKIESEERYCRFSYDTKFPPFALAYLVERKKEPVYKPFDLSDIEVRKNLIGKAIIKKSCMTLSIITSIGYDDVGWKIVGLGEAKYLLECYTFLDGSPCGVKVDE